MQHHESLGLVLFWPRREKAIALRIPTAHDFRISANERVHVHDRSIPQAKLDNEINVLFP